MSSDIINIHSGKVNDYIHHIDLKEFGKERILSCYIAQFDECSLFLDCGTSLEVNRALRYAKNNNIPLESFQYLIASHHHFDHNGGMWKLYKKLEKYNPELKVVANEQTKILLNNYDEHLARAKRTFGDFIGEMNAIKNQAYKINNPSDNFEIIANLDESDIDYSFTKNGEKIDMAILSTPGHTYDHQSPVFIKNGKIDFLFVGEAAGTVYHSSKLLTMPTSMPVYFNYSQYMDTLEKILKLRIPQLGFCHFGVVNGEQNVQKLLKEHKNFMEEFRDKVIQYYGECPETRYVYDNILPLFLPRTDLVGKDHPIMKNIVLGVVYGMMMDLGYRKD